MNVVYIIGPYRAPTPTGVLRNIAVAREAALQVWKCGAVALCPHLNTALFDGECPDETWLEGDMELLKRCDAVFLVGWWIDSRGSLEEVKAALQQGKPLFDDFASLREWNRKVTWPASPTFEQLVTVLRAKGVEV